MERIAIAAFAATGSIIALATVGPSKTPFNYATATLEDKQRYLEAKAKNFSRGFNLTKGGASEISDVYVDAESDLVSIIVQIKGASNGYIPAGQLETMRSTIQKTACSLTERDLLTQTDFKLRMRFLKPGGGSLMTVEASGDSCAPYFS